MDFLFRNREGFHKYPIVWVQVVFLNNRQRNSLVKRPATARIRFRLPRRHFVSICSRPTGLKTFHRAPSVSVEVIGRWEVDENISNCATIGHVNQLASSISFQCNSPGHFMRRAVSEAQPTHGCTVGGIGTQLSSAQFVSPTTSRTDQRLFGQWASNIISEVRQQSKCLIGTSVAQQHAGCLPISYFHGQPGMRC